MQRAILVLCAMTACAVDPEMMTGSTQGLVCDPCDPGGAQTVINELWAYGDQWGLTLYGPAHCTLSSSGSNIFCTEWGVDPTGDTVLVSCSSYNPCSYMYWQ